MVNFNTSQVTFFFFLLLSQAKSFNITSLLNHYSSFSNFNNYLTQTGVSAAINSRQTITVLVVENNNLSPLKGMSQDAIANIMRVHVLLDYYDVPKMQMLPNKTMKTPTLFQTTGYADNDQGFLNITDLGTGSISLGSAAKGETLGSNLVKSIASQPYNISILQISNVIIPSGIDSSTPASPPPSSPPAPISSAPTYSQAYSPHGSSAAPASSTDAYSPAYSPHGSSAAPAPSTDAYSSAYSPHGSSAAPAPGTDAPESEAAETPTEASPTPAPHHLPPKPDAPTASASADAPSPTASASADAPAPAPTGDHASDSSILGVSLVFVAMTNFFLVLVI